MKFAMKFAFKKQAAVLICASQKDEWGKREEDRG